MEEIDIIEKIKSQPDHMSEENRRFCDFANPCTLFDTSKCYYEYMVKCPIAIANYQSYNKLK